jgi:plasmid stabilization system protein ParE
MKIVWSAPAVTDLDAIRTYIARDSETYADALILEIFEAADRLERFPESGRVVPELNDPTTREIIVGSYRVMYDITGDAVRILGVLPWREAISAVQMKQDYAPRLSRTGNQAATGIPERLRHEHAGQPLDRIVVEVHRAQHL